MTIMVTDNCNDRLMDLVKQLQVIYPGGNIMCFTDPMMAVKYSFNHPVNIVFTDIMLRRIDGFTLSEGVHQKNPNVKVFFLADTDEYRQSAIKRGGSGYLVRPVTTDGIKQMAL